MKTSELRTKSEDELRKELMDLRKERFNFRFQKSTGQLENTGRVRVVRRDIAKIKTLLNEQKQGKTVAAKPAKKAKAEKAATPAKKKKEIKE